MTNAEHDQHTEAADAATEQQPCDGMRRAMEDRVTLYDQCFGFDAIKERMQVVNKAYAASHGLLDETR